VTQAQRTATGSRRGIVVGVAAVVVVLVVAVLLAGDSGSGGGEPLSPSSTSDDGLRGLVLLLQGFGADVRTAPEVPDGTVHVAFLVRDGLDSGARSRLRAWVQGGGTLVVADTSSPLSASTTSVIASSTVTPGACDIAALGDVERLDLGAPSISNLGELGDRFDATNASSCFGDGNDAFVVRRAEGRGAIVSVGSTSPFVNALLTHADNSVLAVRLLLPNGPEPVAVLSSAIVGGGQETLFDLIAERVAQAFVQAGIAFVLYALWRARRLGRPVIEPQSVQIAGSQLVRAVGALEQRTRAAQRAATVVRADALRSIRHRYGLAPDAPAEVVADVVAAGTGLDHDRVAAALRPPAVYDEASLVELTHELDVIRKEVLDDSRR